MRRLLPALFATFAILAAPATTLAYTAEEQAAVDALTQQLVDAQTRSVELEGRIEGLNASRRRDARRIRALLIRNRLTIQSRIRRMTTPEIFDVIEVAYKNTKDECRDYATYSSSEYQSATYFSYTFSAFIGAC